MSFLTADSLAAEKTGKEVAAAETGKEVASVETGKEVASVETGKQGSAVVMGKEPSSAAAPVKRAAVVASRKEVSAVETGKEVSAVSGVIKDGDMDDTAERAMFMDKDGKMNWLGYIDYLRFGSDCEDKKTPEQEKVEELWKDADRVSEREDLIDEAAMKIRFQEWMEKFGKKYRSKEETAMRYKRFKKVAKFSDDYNAFKSSNVISPNYFADITEEEYKIMHPLPERDDQYWEVYVALFKSMLAHRNANSHGAVTGSHGHEAGIVPCFISYNVWDNYSSMPISFSFNISSSYQLCLVLKGRQEVIVRSSKAIGQVLIHSPPKPQNTLDLCLGDD